MARLLCMLGVLVTIGVTLTLDRAPSPSRVVDSTSTAHASSPDIVALAAERTAPATSPARDRVAPVSDAQIEPLSGSFAPPSTDAEAPLATGDLDALSQKMLNKAEKQLAKLEKKLTKAVDREETFTTNRAGWQSLLAQSELDLIQANADLADAESALADALLMPQTTKEEKKARKAAIKAAKKARAIAKKDIKVANRRIKKSNKRTERLDERLAKVGVKIVTFSDQIEELDSLVDSISGEFDFVSTRNLKLEGVLRNELGQGLGFAQVTVLDTLDPAPVSENPLLQQTLEEFVSPAVYWQGFTQADGSFQAVLSLPGTIDEVDIVVTKPGFEGEYEVEEFRELWGPFAPAARLRRTDTSLQNIDVVLTEKESL